MNDPEAPKDPNDQPVQWGNAVSPAHKLLNTIESELDELKDWPGIVVRTAVNKARRAAAELRTHL